MKQLPPNAKRGIPIGDRFKLSKDGKRVTPDEAKELAKLNIPQRIKRRKSTKTRFAPRTHACKS